MFSNILKYIKNNKFYIAIMIIGLLAFIIQMNFVILYADDFALGKIASEGGFIGACKHLETNYINWGGGPTPFVAIIFLIFGLNTWKIFNIAIIFLIIILSVRMITYNSKINKGIIASILWICIYILNIYISRETLYWLDGNLAYVLTAFQLLLFFYYLYSRLIMKTKKKKYDLFLLPLVAFFAGWTGPQTGAGTVIVGILLLLWAKFIYKERIDKLYIISLFMGIVGFLVEILAPGNSSRLLVACPEFAKLNIFEKICYRLDNVFGLLFNFKIYGFGSLPFYMFLFLGIISYIAFKLSYSEKNKIISIGVKVISITIISFITLILIISLNIFQTEFFAKDLITFNNILDKYESGLFRWILIIPYLICSLIILCSIILSYYISVKSKNPLLVILVSLSFLAQLMMLLSPYSPFRTTFITAIFLWIAIGYMIRISYDNNIKIGYIIMLPLAIYHFQYAIIYLIIYLLFTNDKNKNETIIMLIMLGILALNNYTIVLKNYKQNKLIYNENIARIEKFTKNESGEKELYLLYPTNEIYGFSPLLGTQWVEDVVKNYFGLDKSIVFIREN